MDAWVPEVGESFLVPMLVVLSFKVRVCPGVGILEESVNLA